LAKDEIGPGDGKQDNCCPWSGAFPSLQPLPYGTADEAQMCYLTMRARGSRRGSRHGTADSSDCGWPAGEGMGLSPDGRGVAASGQTGSAESRSLE